MKTFTLFESFVREVGRVFPAHPRGEALAANMEEAVRKHIRVILANYTKTQCKECGTDLYVFVDRHQGRVVALDAAANDHRLTCPRTRRLK